MRIVVDRNLCESHGLCMASAPKVFELRDDDVMYVLDEHPPESLRDKVELAVQRCPKNALKIEPSACGAGTLRRSEAWPERPGAQGAESGKLEE